MGREKNCAVLLIGHKLAANARLREELSAKGFAVSTAARGEEGLAKAIESWVDVVVSEFTPSGLTGLELLRQLRQLKPCLPVIFVAEAPSPASAIEAFRLGAYDTVTEPFEAGELVELIKGATATKGVPLIRIESPAGELALATLVGSSRVMHDLFKKIGVAAGSSGTVLIRGATGTGKELVAQAIHRYSSRAKQRFIVVNCNAIPDTLFESHLLGHDAGAFTGAYQSRPGWFEQAHRGTLFLDEIGDLKLEMQVKLLRALEEKCVQRLGSRQPVAVDVRIVAATNRDLEERMEAGGFRADLFYRLKAFTIKTPELSEHHQDIPELVEHLLRKLQREQALGAVSVEAEAVEFLTGAPWPGNVRELENAVRHAASLAGSRPISLGHVQQARGPTINVDRTRRNEDESLADLLEKARSGEPGSIHANMVEQVERWLLARAMAVAGGNQSIAAHWLGIARGTLREKLLHLGMLPPKQECLLGTMASQGMDGKIKHLDFTKAAPQWH